MSLTYAARTQTPDAADIDRIVADVIAQQQFIETQHPPEHLMPQSFRANLMAREIKRRLCDLISVEVDLVITGSTGEDDTPAPLTLADGATISFISTQNRALPNAPVFISWIDSNAGAHAHEAPVIADGSHTHTFTELKEGHALHPCIPARLLRPHFFGSFPGPF